MKKVLFVATVDIHIVGFHIPYLKMFHDDGYEVHVATNSDKEVPFCDKKICLPIRRSPFKFIPNIKSIIALRKVINSEKYDIIHCHTPMGGVVARLAAKKARRGKTRVIYTAHGFHFYNGAPLHYWLLFYPIEWFLSKYTDTLITINDEDYNRAKSKFGKRCKDIAYVPGVGVDFEKFGRKINSYERICLRKELGLKNDDIVFTYPAELSKRKNQFWLIDAIAGALKENSKIHLLLPGKDSLAGKCQKLAVKLGVGGQIHFLGFRSDIDKILQITDVAISSSRQEGLPVNLIEAAASGLPIIATDCRGNRDICNVVENSILVGIQDKKAMRSAVEKAILIRRNRLGAEEVVSVFGCNSVFELMRRIYNKRIKVLHLLASRNYSGAENMACTIIANMSDSFEMAYCSPDGPVGQKIAERNVNYIGIKDLKYRHLKKIVCEFNPKIIHAHDYRASVMARRFRRYGIRIVSHIHQDSPTVRKLSVASIVYKVASASFDKTIWVSDAAYRNYYFSKSINAKSVVLYNIVDREYIRKCSKSELNHDRYDVVFVGRLIELKKPKRALGIMKSVLSTDPTIKMAFIGDGEDFNDIKNAVARLGLCDSIKMCGFVKNPYPILRNSKVLLITSVREGTPMVMLEAQALGKPVVSTKLSGFDRIIQNGCNGFLANSDQALSAAILEIVDDSKYRNYVKNTKEHFNTINDEHKYFDTLRGIYEG